MPDPAADKPAVTYGRCLKVMLLGASPPRQQQLPTELQTLARLNAQKLSYDRYQYDADQLLDLIQRVLAALRERDEAERQARQEELRI
jgi:hypothetical protein